MKNSKLVLRLTAVLLAAFLSLGMLCACGEDEEDNPVDEDAAARLQMILSDPWYYTDDTPVAFDQAVSKEFRENGGFEYERSAAQKVFGGDKVKVSKTACRAFESFCPCHRLKVRRCRKAGRLRAFVCMKNVVPRF